MARAGKQKGSAHPNVEAAVRGWQTHEYADAGAAADALERGNNRLYEEMYPGDDAKTARRKFHRLINAQLRKPEVSRSEKPEEPVPVNARPKRLSKWRKAGQDLQGQPFMPGMKSKMRRAAPPTRHEALAAEIDSLTRAANGGNGWSNSRANAGNRAKRLEEQQYDAAHKFVTCEYKLRWQDRYAGPGSGVPLLQALQPGVRRTMPRAASTVASGVAAASRAAATHGLGGGADPARVRSNRQLQNARKRAKQLE